MESKKFPNKFVEIVFNLNRVVGKVESWLSMAILWALIAVVVIFIVCRYVLYISTPWADELARYFLIALGWCGASYAASVGDHLEIDLIGSIIPKVSKNPRKVFAVIDRFAQILSLIFMVLFTQNYFVFTLKILGIGKKAESMGFLMFYPMTLVTIGCVLVTLHILCKVLLPYDYWDNKTPEEREAK